MHRNDRKDSSTPHKTQLSGAGLCHDILSFFTTPPSATPGALAFDLPFLECLRDACGAEAASIWRLDSKSRLELVLSTDITAPADIAKVKTIGLTRGMGVSGQAVLHRRTLGFSKEGDRILHDGQMDKALGRTTFSMVSSPIVWGTRTVYGVVNVVNVSDIMPLEGLKEVTEIAARLYAEALLCSGKYDAPDHAEVAGRYPFLVYSPDGPYADVVAQCELYAQSDDPVLLLGETGTGKELFAKVIFNASQRPKPHLAMDCGASVPERVADELFGHVKGAFTGAEKETEGFVGDTGHLRA